MKETNTECFCCWLQLITLHSSFVNVEYYNIRVWTFFLSVSSTVVVSSLLPFRLSPPQSTQMRNLSNYSLYCFQSAPMKHANQHFHCFDLYVNSAFTGEKGTTNFSRLVVDAQNNSTNTDSRAPTILSSTKFNLKWCWILKAPFSHTSQIRHVNLSPCLCLGRKGEPSLPYLIRRGGRARSISIPIPTHLTLHKLEL